MNRPIKVTTMKKRRYQLMNKNDILANFNLDSKGLVYDLNTEGKMPIHITSVEDWVHNRPVAKHRDDIEDMLIKMGLDTPLKILEYSKGLSLIDTLWINKDEKYNWKDINLYDNNFSEVISNIVLEGDKYSINPADITTGGMLNKRWVRESDYKTYLYKSGTSGFANTGNEPYVEMYVTQIAKVLDIPHVIYNTVKYQGNIMSRCPNMTEGNSILMHASSFCKCGMPDLLEACVRFNCLDRLEDLFLLDYVIINTDRHLNNIAFIMDSNLEESSVRMSPSYDHGFSLLHFAMKDDFEEHYKSRRPTLYPTFEERLTKRSKKKLENLIGFKFDRTGEYNLEDWRLNALEDIIQDRIRIGER